MNSVLSISRRVLNRIAEPLRKAVAPRFASGTGFGPACLLIQLNYTCNLRCWFCNQWGSTGVYRQLPRAELAKRLPLAVLKRVINELPATTGAVSLWGGETLQYPEIVPLVRHIRNSGLGCSLVTNGTQLSYLGPGLVDAQVNVVNVSLDSTEEEHDRHRGSPGTYQAAMQGIKTLAETRSATGSRRPFIVVGCTLLPDSLEELPGLIEAVRNAGADRLGINPLSYTSQQLGEAHSQAFRDIFGIEAQSWRGFVRPELAASPERIERTIASLKAATDSDFLLWSNDWTPADWYQYYSDPRYVRPQNRRCRFPWDAACIYPNGDVALCPDFPDYVVGNVLEESFRRIWKSEKSKRFRRALAHHGRFPICSVCCHLYDT